MRLRLLGPVELVADDGTVVEIGPGKRRAVLAVLGLSADHVVPVDRLVELLWDGDPPPRARTAVQGHVSALRRVLGPGLELLTKDPGYELRVGPGLLDVERFRMLVAAAESADLVEATENTDISGVADVGGTGQDGTPSAVALLREALALWRGPALADLIGRGLPEAIVAGLHDARRDALVALADRLLAAGRGGEAVADLRAAAADAPLHEPLAGALMLSLYQADRQADALEVFHATRRRLADALGVDPGAPLQAAYQTVLGVLPVGGGAGGVGGGGVGGGVGGGGARTAGSPPAVPAQLPRVPSGFVGRRRELAWLDGRLGEDGLVLVTGPAGIGKTALVLRWAHRAAELFPDGQLHIDLRGFDHGPPLSVQTALERFLTALGVPEAQIPAGAAEREALYRTRMAGRRTLVVIDNARSAEQVRPLLPGTPRSHVVVTSRHRFDGLIARDGAVSLTVPALSAAEAQELLARVAGTARIDAEPAAAARLAELCDRIPLALRVASSRLVISPAWTVADLTAELLDEHSRLSALSTQDADLGVEAALSLTYQVLPEPAATLFRMLGVHPGTELDRYAAAALTGADPRDAGRALTALSGCHLMYQRTADRYGCHDLVRLYARGLAERECDAEQRRAALARLLDYYEAATLLARELVRPDDSERVGEPPAAAAAAGSAGSAGSGAEARPTASAPAPAAAAAARTASAGSPAPAASAPPPVPALADPAGAFAWFAAEEETIRVLVRAADVPDRAWRIADNCVPLYTGAGDRGNQVACLAAGVAAARAVGDVRARFRLLARLGPLLARLRRPTEARECLAEAATLVDATVDDTDRLDLLVSLADAEVATDRWPAAREHYEQALAVATTLAAPVRQAQVLCALAGQIALHGEAVLGLRHAGRALELIRHIPVGPLHLDIVLAQAFSLGKADRLDASQKAYQVVIDTAQKNGYQLVLAQACHGFGCVLHRLGRLQEAEQKYRTALDFYLMQGLWEAEHVRELMKKVDQGLAPGSA